MKKSLLLLTALVAGAFTISAQTTDEGDPIRVQQRPFGEDQSIPGYLTLSEARIEVGSTTTAESAPKDVYSAADEKAEFNGVSTAPTFANTHDGDIIEFHVTSSEASYYVITVYTGSKNDGGSIDLAILDGENELWTGSIAVPNSGNWSSRSWSAPYAIVNKQIPAGTYTFRMTMRQVDTKANVVNIAGIQFESSASVPTQCEIYPALELLTPDGYDAGEDAGKIVISPSMDKYISGTELTATATANVGYRFLYFYLNSDDSEKVYENPYKFNITKDTDISAVFEKLDMDNYAPGKLDLLKAVSAPSNVASGKAWNVTASCKVDGTAQEVTYLSDCRNPCEVTYNVTVNTAGKYVVKFAQATKKTDAMIKFKFSDADANSDAAPVEAGWGYTSEDFAIAGGWTNFTTVQTPEIELTAGKKLLTISLSGGKETLNVCNVEFVLTNGDNPSGIEDIVVNEANAGEVKAYNLQGIQVAPDTKGLIIINGKKVYNK